MKYDKSIYQSFLFRGEGAGGFRHVICLTQIPNKHQESFTIPFGNIYAQILCSGPGFCGMLLNAYHVEDFTQTASQVTH